MKKICLYRKENGNENLQGRYDNVEEAQDTVKKLTEAERYNSRFKQAGCESVFVRNGNSVKNLNTIAHISLLSIAIAAVITKKDVSYRSVKTLKRLT